MNATFSAGFLWRAAALAAAASLAAAPAARAHAFLERADPAVGSSLTRAPARVELSFTEDLEAGFSQAQVFDASGQEVDRRDGHLDPQNHRRLVVSLPASLRAGTYRVAWRVVSVDTHVTSGGFNFRVEP